MSTIQVGQIGTPHTKEITAIPLPSPTSKLSLTFPVIPLHPHPVIEVIPPPSLPPPSPTMSEASAPDAINALTTSRCPSLLASKRAVHPFCIPESGERRLEGDVFHVHTSMTSLMHAIMVEGCDGEGGISLRGRGWGRVVCITPLSRSPLIPPSTARVHYPHCLWRQQQLASPPATPPPRDVHWHRPTSGLSFHPLDRREGLRSCDRHISQALILLLRIAPLLIKITLASPPPPRP